MTHDIAGKVVVITDASSGRGEAAAPFLSAQRAGCAMPPPEEVDGNEILCRPTAQGA